MQNVRKGLSSFCQTARNQAITRSSSHWVNFVINVEHKTLGKVLLESKWKLPHDISKKSRQNVTPAEMAMVADNSMGWVGEHFDVKGREDRYRQLTNHATVMGVLTTPQSEALLGDITTLWSKYCAWFWIYDDILDSTNLCDENTINLESMRMFSSCVDNILSGKYKELDIKSLSPAKLRSTLSLTEADPIITSVCSSYLDIVQSATKLVPSFPEFSQPLYKPLKLAYLRSFDWSLLRPFDEYYSDEVFINWRSVESAAKPATVFLSLLLGGQLPLEIQMHPIFTVFMELLSNVLALFNDVLGAKKDFVKGETDSLVAFKIFKKNTKPEAALEEVVNILTKRVEQLHLIRKDLFKLYPNCKQLSDFVGAVDLMMDGANQMYLYSPHYLMQDSSEIVKA